jgi:uncharacterized membrane protein YcaP (DUF421 family)
MMGYIDAVFGPTGHVTWGQECARAVLVFAYGLALVRIAGRRVFGKWSALDIVVSIIIGSNLSRALTGSADLVGTLLATTLLMILHWVLARVAARSARLSRLIEGGAVQIARNGQLQATALQRQAVSEADLNEALRQSGLEDPSSARQIILEPSGKINVLKSG